MIATLEQNRLTSVTAIADQPQTHLINPEIYWDEMISIEFTGFKPVYDLTIPETHNFVANDICVHNTSFAVGIAHNIAKNQKLSTAIYSLEMSKEQLVQRLLSSESRIESNRLRSGRISQAEWEPLTEAIGTLSELSIFIDDTPNITVTEMRSKARRLQAEHGGELGLVLIDYLQLMEGSSDNRVQELSRITRALKGMARELNVPVIALSQLSRGVEARTNKRPMMSDLRESGCITGDSLISLANQGIEVPIQELIGKSGFAVWAINPATMKLEKATVSHVFNTGVKPIFKLKTALGRTIRATANHKFLTIQGWQRLEQLQVGSRIALSPCRTTLYTPHFSSEPASKLAQVVHSEKLALLAESDIYWDKVISIEPDGDEEVYDLTVPELHNFIANNIVVHNSIEQDADLVIMLYRDDYYNPDTPDRGISEIIITKHRNGPTGTVKLLFDPQFTRFRNLAASERYSFPKNPPNQLPPG
jgi:replicative DNA helicase